MDNNEVSLDIVASDFTKVRESLNELISGINKATTSLGKLEKKSTDASKKTQASMREANLEISKMGDNANKTAKQLTNFGNSFDFVKSAVASVKKLSKLFDTVVQKAVDYSEELNLFNVIFKNNMSDVGTEFSDAGLEAERFQQTLHEAFGTNLLETRRFQALFQSMGENMGIVTDKAEVMSSNLTKLTYDIASLYNASEKDVGQALKAGIYAGQTKPLRQFGIDVTQTSMQPIMNELGLDKSISELTQAEKQILRYISVLRQASSSHGDFANTIESPANQLKIFKQQLVECQIALGNLFIGAYARILPYANALLMVIKEVARAIASFFGMKIEDYNSGIASSYEDLGDSLDDVGASAGSASNAVKELNRQTLKFDQINNIKSPTPKSGSSGGGGGGISGGIDQKLLDAIKGYENGMEKVRMKANEIRDKIMEWLGFTKQIDPITGEVSWKYQGLDKTLKNMWDSFKGLSTTGKIIAGLGIIAGATTLVSLGGKLITLFGSSGLGKVVTALIGPTATLFTTIAKNKGTLSTSITQWKQYRGILDENGKAVSGLQGAMAKLTTVATGAVVSIGGLAVYHDSFKSIREDGANLGNVLGTIGGSIATISGAMEIGATVAGPYGAVIGGVAGAVAILVDTMIVASDQYPQFTKALEEHSKKINDITDSYHNNIKAIEDGVKANDYQIDSDKKLMEELQSITDENGKVKAGYEDRANFILGRMKEAYGVEYSMVDGIIQNYKGVVKSINDVISAKKAQIYFNAYEQEYAESVTASAKAEAELKSTLKDRNKVQTELNEVQDRANELINRNKEIKEKLAENDGMITYETKALTAELEKNTKELESNSNKQNDLNSRLETWDEKVKKATSTYIEATNTQTKYSEIWKAQQEGNWAEVERLYKEGTNKTTTYFKDSLIEQAKSVQEGSPIPSSVIEGFRVLAVNSNKKYKEALGELPTTTAEQIDKSVKELDKKKKSVYGKHFELGEEGNAGYNTATKGLADETVLKFSNKLTNKENKKKLNEAGQTTGKEIMSGVKKETDKGVDVKVNANTNGVTSNVRSAVNNWGNGYTVDIYPRMQGNAQITITQNGRALGGVFSNGTWKNIKQYANGGIPTHGTMFTAGERGPEIVGHIGRRTEVLNQSQLASVMYEAVSRALTNSNFGGIEFHAHTDEGVVIDRINRITRQTGECPLTI